MTQSYDFSGIATKANVKCCDGVTIKPGAFKKCDGKTVPLVWNHNHSSVDNILGHALLRYDESGDVIAYCSLNGTESGEAARTLVEHGDITALSILAKVKKAGIDRSDVVHGDIKEVSMVLAGANPEAIIETVVAHSEDSESVQVLFTDSNGELDIRHGELEIIEHVEKSKEEDEKEDKPDEKESEEETKDDETIEDIFETLSEKQKNVVYYMVKEAAKKSQPEKAEEKNNATKEEKNTMKHNLFENEQVDQTETISHDAMNAIIGDAKRYGSMKESFLQHAETYGIDKVEYLFPEAKTVTPTPEFIQRDMSWVDKVMGAVHHTPFSRVKSVFANITEDDARARGYMKGKLKKEEVFSLLKRSTDPTTVYKKQKLDRDDVIDITDFDVVSWLKTEMRMMLNEELARAYLVGDGRLASSDDKINENNIRPIWTDAPLYTIKAVLNVKSADTPDTIAKAFIRAAIKARKDYKGSGQPTMFTTEDVITDCLLLEDTTGRRLYSSVQELATVLRVKEIIPVPVMEGLKRHDNEDSKDHNLMALIVNLADYNVGADKGGAINMFDDFDIDYNQQKYLIETRCSGALIKPYSAIAIETVVEG